MKIPIETKPALWGAVGGAAILLILGFGWSGWTTAGKAESMARDRANDAVVTALAPLCVEKFDRSDTNQANRAALKLMASWSQGEYVEKGGWAGVGTGQSPERIAAVARACANLLTQG